jgi:CBS domain-containing protein
LEKRGDQVEIRALVGNGATTTTADTTLHKAADRMVEERVGSLGILDGNLLAGIITERDVLRAAASGVDLGTATVFDWMTPRPDVTEPDMDVYDAAQWMLATGYRHLPVVEGNRLLGIASIKDILWAITEPGHR